jgi:hypothetical protein
MAFSASHYLPCCPMGIMAISACHYLPADLFPRNTLVYVS